MPDTSEFTPTDTNPYSLPAVWSKTYADMRGTDWDDWTSHREVGAALCYAYRRTGSDDGVLATLMAAHQARNTAFMSPVDVCAAADAFVITYNSFDEPLQDYLDETYNGLRHQHLNEEGRRQMEREICRDSEVWIDNPEKLHGVWVFNKPGYSAK